MRPTDSFSESTVSDGAILGFRSPIDIQRVRQGPGQSQQLGFLHCYIRDQAAVSKDSEQLYRSTIIRNIQFPDLRPDDCVRRVQRRLWMLQCNEDAWVGFQ